MRAIAAASAVTYSLLSAYDPLVRPLQSMPDRSARPPWVVAAAQVDQAAGAVDERREQVRSDDVDRHHVPAGVDAGVVDHGVEAAEAVDLVGDAARLLEVGEVPDDRRCAAVDELA